MKTAVIINKRHFGFFIFTVKYCIEKSTPVLLMGDLDGVCGSWLLQAFGKAASRWKRSLSFSFT